MKAITTVLILFLSVFFYPLTGHAKNYNMIFWYPGEAGSTAEAAPVLESLFDYLNSRLKGNKFSGKYFNSTSSGLINIKKSRPNFAIVSWIALKENESTIPPFSILAQTLPYPDGAPTDQFTIVGIKPQNSEKWKEPENLVIDSSVPISLSFLKAHLTPDLTGNISLRTTNTLLMTLKKIASNSNENEVALLTPIEKFTLDNLKTEWANKLTLLYKCREVPTAVLLYFGNKPPIADNLLKTLTNMASDPEGKEILESLRLKGFKPAG